MVVRVSLVIFLIVAAYVANAFTSPIPDREFEVNFRPMYGVTYSFEQAGWYGLDPKESYIRLLEEFNFDWVRLPFFWDQTLLLRQPFGSESQGRRPADSEGQVGHELNLDDLKFAIEEADKRGVKAIIALGAKTPYFPEYHLPKEIADQIAFGQRIGLDHPIADDILAIDQKVVEALSGYVNIIAWQVENEPLIGNINKWKIDPALIAAEVELVRQADPLARPIILNHAATGFYDQSWEKLLPILESGDVFAVNAFLKTKGTDLITAKIFGGEIHVLWPDHFVWPVYSWGIFSPDFAKIKKTVEANGNQLWILEMQAEPYIKKLEESEDPFLSFTPVDIKKADQFLRSYEIKSIGLWGAHFWQYKEEQGDRSWVEAIKDVVNN